MFRPFAQTIILITLITLASACGPAATPVSPTATIAPTPSAAHGQTISTEISLAVVPPIETAIPPAAAPAPLTAEQLIAECAQAMGGSEKIDALQTLRLAQHFPDHTGLIRYEIKRPNLVRMGDDLAFDGKQAFWLTKTEPVPQQEWKDFEMDIAWYIPAFFDYPAECLGTEMVDGNWTYKLQVPLPLGAVMLYYLDAETYLVYRASSDVAIGEKKYHYERTFSDYRLVDGILYPHAFTYVGRNGVDLLTATIKTIEFNILLGNERFAAPQKPTSTPPLAVQLEQVAAFDYLASFVHTVAFSPDGRYLITADQNGDVIVREVGTWKEHRRFTTQADIASAPLSPDGMLIVTGGAAGNVVAWDLAGNELFSIPYSSAVFCVQFSPDGRYLVVGGENDRVMIVDVATQQKVTDLVSDHHYVTNLIFSPDGKTLLVSYERQENVIKIWDTSTWEEGATFSHVTERIDYHDLVFSPDGRYLVVASTQNAIKFLDVVTWQVVKELEGHTRGTYQIAFSPDGALLVSASDDGTLRLWDVETGDNLKTIRGYRENVALALSPDGVWIAFSGWEEGVQVWAVSPAANSSPAPTPALQAAVDPPPISQDNELGMNDIAFLPDRLLLACSGHDHQICF